jgi:KamA family protein
VGEVLLSGGDPLTLPDGHLSELARDLSRIPHLRRLRVHTRLPVVIPERVTESLRAWLRGTRLTPVLVIHANHPQELDNAVAAALARLIDAGIPVLNQSVLLRGVNDAAEPLIELSRRLLDCRVLPYYLHQLDRVAGAAHFEVPVERGLQIIAQMRACLPGYGVPRYVQEIPGESHKRVLA